VNDKHTSSWWLLRFLGLLRRGVPGRQRVHLLLVGHVTVVMVVVLAGIDAVLGRHLTGRRHGGARDSGDLRQADGRTVGQRRVAALEQERAVVHQPSSYTNHARMPQYTASQRTIPNSCHNFTKY